MEALIILLLVGLALGVFVLPIIAIVKSSSTQAQLRRVQEQHDQLLAQLQDLRRSVENSLRSTNGKTTTTAPPNLPSAPSPTTSPASVLGAPSSRGLPTAGLQPPAQPAEPPTPRPDAGINAPTGRPAQTPPPIPRQPGPPPTPNPTPPSSRPPTSAAPAFNWERFVGTKLIAWLGGLVLFLAAAYFIKYSFDHAWIPRELQAALGFALGGGLVGGGFVLKRKAFAISSQTFCATGILILYAVTFGCHAYYEFPLFTPLVTFAFMGVITAAGFGLSVKMEARVVAVLGMVGGFLTPLILSTGRDNALGLFLYIGLLDAGLIAVALVTRWSFLIPLGAVGTVLMQLGWSSQFLVPAKILPAVLSQISFNLLFLCGAELAYRQGRLDSKWTGSAAALGIGAVLYAMGLIYEPGLGTPLGWCGGVALAGDICLIMLVLRQPSWTRLQQTGAVLVHVFLGLWMLEHLETTTLFWALGAVLVIAVLHTVAPLWMARVRPEAGSGRWTLSLPPVGLLMMLFPVFKLPTVSLSIWLLILLINLLAIGLAVATRSLVSAVAALLITGVVGASWILRLPASSSDLSLLLVIVGGMAVTFLFAGMFALNRILGSTESGEDPLRRAFGGVSFTGDQSREALMAQLPMLSAMMPFMLLILIVVHLHLPNPSSVFALAMALALLLLSIARTFQRGGLVVMALVAVVLLQMAWHGRAFDPALNAKIALGWQGGFSLLVFAFPFLSGHRFLGNGSAWAASAMAFPLHFFGAYQTVQATWPTHYLGLMPAALALPPTWALCRSTRLFSPENLKRNTVMAWYGGAALFFITLIFPVQFEREWITVSWALEGAALCWLYHRIPHPGLRWVGTGLLAISFIRLALNPAVLSYHPRSQSALLNWYLYSFGLVTAALFIAGRLLAPPRDRAGRFSFPALLYSLGTILLFLLVNVEIADYFTPAGSSVLTFRFGGNFARDMSYTIGWGVFALGLVSAGIMRGLKAARYAGLALMGVTLLKLFIHDLSRLGPLYRIGALVGVAVVAILASVLYQRFIATEEQKSTAAEPPSMR